MKTEINISGVNINLTPIDDSILKILPLNTYVRYNLALGAFKGVEMCFLEEKETVRPQSPTQCLKTAENLQNILRCPIVFIFDKIPYIQRQRMIERGVYFAVSRKYANLPNFFVNVVDNQRTEKKSPNLSPVAQYIMLYYLQHDIIDFDKIASIQKHTPFSYLQVTRAVVDLENFGLCESKATGSNGKCISFDRDKRLLWTKALQHMRNPVRTIIYADSNISLEMNDRISGMNALAHYSSLNQVRQKTIALGRQDFKSFSISGIETNTIEGSTAIQEWIYPPTICSDSKYVDPLSLWLSLNGDRNPRVENALEQLIETMKW